MHLKLISIVSIISTIVEGNQSQTTARTGLKPDGNRFTLDGRDFQIRSGSVHYFRVPRAYWRDRLLKLKSCGLNTVETYVAWNFHELRPGEFDFTGDCIRKKYENQENL